MDTVRSKFYRLYKKWHGELSLILYVYLGSLTNSLAFVAQPSLEFVASIHKSKALREM